VRYFYCQNDYQPEHYYWEVVELIRKLVLSSCLMLMSRENPWQVASATIISMTSHLLYTHCRPMLQPQTQILQHVALGVTTLNCKPPLASSSIRTTHTISRSDLLGLMLKVQAIENSGAVGPLMIILNLGMVIGLVAIGASRLHKMKHEVSREDEKDEKLTKRRASADNSGYPAGYGDGDCNIGRQVNPMHGDVAAVGGDNGAGAGGGAGAEATAGAGLGAMDGKAENGGQGASKDGDEGGSKAETPPGLEKENAAAAVQLLTRAAPPPPRGECGVI
jgi:hypothetical protein